MLTFLGLREKKNPTTIVKLDDSAVLGLESQKGFKRFLRWTGLKID